MNTKLFYILLIISILIIGCTEPTPPINTCNGERCSENQKCVEKAGKESCQCNNGYDLVDDKCEKNKCFGVDCAENEECIILNEETKCECKDGFQLEGDKCEKIPTECAELTCKANEICILKDELPICECNENFYKENDICTFDCRNIEGASANTDNTACICNDSNY